MKTSSKISSLLSLVSAVLMLLVFSASQVDAQCIQNAITKAQVATVTCNDCDVCVIAEVGTGNYYVRQGKASSAGANLKVTGGNKAVSAADVAKMPGMAKFRPFRGNDDVQISVDKNTLIFHGNEGTAGENPLDLCEDNGKQQCKNPTWVISNDGKAGNDTYTIQPKGQKNAYLCFSASNGGLTVYRDPAKADQCIQWSIVPSELGADGEIKGYKIYPKKHPEYILTVDTRSNEVRMDKVNNVVKEGGEPNKAVLTNWTFVPNSSKRKVTNQERVIKEAEQK